MKKNKNYKRLCLALGLGVIVSGGALQAASITKTLKAIYNNIAISYNGQIKKLSAEPFTVNGTTYVPLRAISEVMGADVSWANNTVYIKAQTASSAAYEQEIAAKSFENASLRQQLEIAKKRLEALEGTESDGKNLTTEAINNTLLKIKSKYKSAYDVAWEYNLQLVSGRLELAVAYHSSYDEADFDKATEGKRKQLIKEICYDIAAVHKEVEIRGTLKDKRNNLERASFKYSQSGSYDYNEAADFSLADFEKELEKNYKVINVIGFSIPINDIKLEENNNVLTFALTTELRPSGTTNDYRARWNTLNGANKNDLQDFLKRIKVDIEHQYSSYDSIVGVIRDSSTGNSLAVYEKDERLYLNSLNIN